MQHADLPDAGHTAHHIIDQNLPTDREKAVLDALGRLAPVAVTGARNNPEAALANLLTALADLGLITDGTTAS